MTEQVRVAYDEAAELYASLFLDALDHDTNARKWLDCFIDCVHPGAGSVADVGCGPGYVTAYLEAAGLPVLGYDLSPAQVAEARKAFPNLTFQVGDLAALDHDDGSLGGIVSRYSLIHMDPAGFPDVFVEWIRALEPGAPLLLSFFGATSTERHGEAFDHKVTTAHALCPATVAGQLEAIGFTVLEVDAQPPPPEGRPFDQATILAVSPVSSE